MIDSLLVRVRKELAQILAIDRGGVLMLPDEGDDRVARWCVEAWCYEYDELAGNQDASFVS